MESLVKKLKDGSSVDFIKKLKDFGYEKEFGLSLNGTDNAVYRKIIDDDTEIRAHITENGIIFKIKNSLKNVEIKATFNFDTKGALDSELNVDLYIGGLPKSLTTELNNMIRRIDIEKMEKTFFSDVYDLIPTLVAINAKEIYVSGSVATTISEMPNFIENKTKFKDTETFPVSYNFGQIKIDEKTIDVNNYTNLSWDDNTVFYA